MECYTTLKVTPDSSISEVKESYINLAKKYHPDGDLETANSKTFAKINYAYSTIMVIEIFSCLDFIFNICLMII